MARPYSPQTRLWRWIRAAWRNAMGYLTRHREISAAPSQIEPPATIVRGRRRKRSARSVQWVFRGAILDRLDEYFACIAKMRKHDPEGYAMFRRVGAVIPAEHFIDGSQGLTSPNRPMFGALMWPSDDRIPSDTVMPSFVYFQRVSRLPFSVEQADGDVYAFTAIWDDRKKGAAGWKSELVFPASCHVVVRPDGSARVLRERRVVMQSIPAKTSVGKRRGSARVPHMRFGVPEWAREYESERPAGVDYGTNSPVGWWLIVAIESWLAALGGVRVAVTKGGQTASIGIELNRAPYFFSDRDLRPDGSKKKIFHAVRAHERQMADGGTVEVKAHYRGARRFTWNGYRVFISKPEGTAYLTQSGPGMEVFDSDEGLPNRPTITPPEAAERIIYHVDR